jgi:hypothetical protein
MRSSGTAPDFQYQRDSDQHHGHSEDAQRADSNVWGIKYAGGIAKQAHCYLPQDRQDNGLHAADAREKQNISHDEGNSHKPAEPHPPGLLRSGG